MKRTLLAIVTCAILPTAAFAAPEMVAVDKAEARANTKVIFDETYAVSARIPYQTGFTAIIDGRVNTNRITLTQSGVGCRLVSSGMQYTTDERSGIFSGILSSTSAAVYTIPEGQISSINLLFEQRIGAATCRITVEADVEGSDDHDPWIDWDTVAMVEISADWGGEPTRIGPLPVEDLIENVRLFIPRECGDVDLLGAAFEYNEDWHELGIDQFRMDRTDEYKTYTWKTSRIMELEQVALRLRGKRRNCAAELQVVYY